MSLLAWWKLDEANASDTRADSSGNGNHCTPFGTGGSQNLPQPIASVPSSVTWATRSTVFDGTDDRLSAASALPAINNFMVMAWIYRTASPAASGETPIAVYNAAATQSTFYWRYAQRSGFTSATSTYKEFAANFASPANNQWIHGAIGWNGTHLKYYVNGVISRNDAIAGTPDPQDSASTPQIGRLGDYNGQYWSGRLFDVRIYDEFSEAIITSAAAGNPAIAGSLGLPLMLGMTGGMDRGRSAGMQRS